MLLLRALTRGASATTRRRLITHPRPNLYSRPCIRHNSSASGSSGHVQDTPAYRILNNNLQAFDAMGKLMLAAHERGWDISPGSPWPINQGMTDDPEFVKLFFAFAHSFKNENDLDTVLTEFYGQKGMDDIMQMRIAVELKAIGLDDLPWERVDAKLSSSDSSKQDSKSERPPPQELYNPSMSITELLVQSLILSFALFLMGGDGSKKDKEETSKDKANGSPKAPIPEGEPAEEMFDGMTKN